MAPNYFNWGNFDSNLSLNLSNFELCLHSRRRCQQDFKCFQVFLEPHPNLHQLKNYWVVKLYFWITHMALQTPSSTPLPYPASSAHHQWPQRLPARSPCTPNLAKEELYQLLFQRAVAEFRQLLSLLCHIESCCLNPQSYSPILLSSSVLPLCHHALPSLPSLFWAFRWN